MVEKLAKIATNLFIMRIISISPFRMFAIID